MSKVNQYKAALKEPANLIGMAGLTALSLATLNPVPLLIGLVAETAYLVFVPDTRWFLARLDKKYDQEVVDRRNKLKQEVWIDLPYDIKQRFVQLENIRNQVSDKSFDGKRWYREVLRKMDYMMEKFLHFGVKQGQFRAYLMSVLDSTDRHRLPSPPVVESEGKGSKKGRAQSVAATNAFATDESVREAIAKVQRHYQDEIDQIVAEAGQEANLHNQAVLDKRREVLARRQEFVVKIGETLMNIRHQLDLMEDTFGMVNDQIRTLSPEQVLADIESVVSQTDTLTERLQDVSPFDTAPLEEGADKLYELS